MRRLSQKSICFYFYIHEPHDLNKINFFEIGTGKNYFTKKIKNDYASVTETLLRVLSENKNFSFSMSISGVFLEHCIEYEPKILQSFKDLVATERVELISETFYHSLAWLFSRGEFAEQIKMQMKLINEVFHKKPRIFRNTELIYNNELAQFLKQMGFIGTLAEGWDGALHGKSPNYVYAATKTGLHPDDKKIATKYSVSAKPVPNFKVLLKNYQLSDKFVELSDPFTFAEEVDDASGETLNIFIDFDKLSSEKPMHLIYDYWKRLTERLEEYKIKFRTASETINYFDDKYELDQHELTSWRDVNRDLQSWTGNEIQNGALRSLYELEDIIKNRVKKTKDKKEAQGLLKEWRLLQSSNYFEKMATHHGVNLDAAYDSYINYMNILNDLMTKV